MMVTFNSLPEAENVEPLQALGVPCSFSLRLETAFRHGVAVGLLLLATTQIATSRAKIGSAVALRGSFPEALTRPCQDTVAGSKRLKGSSKKSRPHQGDEDANATSACLEVRSKALEIQEYLQGYGREQQWNLVDEHIADDAWTFSRKLDRDELLHYTKKDTSTEHVNWTSGVAFIQVKTTELDESFVRVQVSARFQGYGQNLDQFAPPKDTWPLKSTTALEHQLIFVLETHFKNSP